MQCSECWKPPAAGSACQAASPQLGILAKRYYSSHLFYASKPECEGLGEKMPRRTAAAASTIRCHLIPYWQLTHVFGRCRTSLLSCWARGTFRCTSSRIVLSKYDSWLHLVSLDTVEVLTAIHYTILVGTTSTSRVPIAHSLPAFAAPCTATRTSRTRRKSWPGTRAQTGHPMQLSVCPCQC